MSLVVAVAKWLTHRIVIPTYVGSIPISHPTLFFFSRFSHRGVAQLVARVVWDHEVAGSNPVTPTIFENSQTKVRIIPANGCRLFFLLYWRYGNNVSMKFLKVSRCPYSYAFKNGTKSCSSRSQLKGIVAGRSFRMNPFD